MTAYEARNAGTLEAVIALAKLPTTVTVSLDNGGTADIGITWSGSGTYNARGAAYTATGTLTGNDDIVIDEDTVTKTVNVTVTPVDAVNPTFPNTDVSVDPTGGVKTASDLGADILPASGSITVSGVTVNYTIDWGSLTLDVTGNGNTTTFNGTITCDATWLTVPNDDTVTRVVTVVDLTPTFTISATQTAPAFGSQQFGYAQRPTQTITVKNTGTGSVTLNNLPGVTNWTLVQSANWRTPMAAGETRTFTIRPDNFLNAGTYNPTVTITGSSGAQVQVRPTFTVTALSAVESFVTRLYQNVLNRAPEADGLKYWNDKLRSGTTGASVAYGFFFSKELIGRNVSNEEFIDILYRTLLNRPADAAGKAYWLSQMLPGYPRENIFAGFVNSIEFDNLCKQAGVVRGTYTPPAGGMIRVFVTRLYRETLNRAPDQGGLDYWTNILLNGASGSEVARGFVFSNELTNRKLSNADFVEVLYKTLMGRGSDAAGKAYWVNYLNSGVTRQAVFNSFTNSVEFGQICQKHGIKR